MKRLISTLCLLAVFLCGCTQQDTSADPAAAPDASVAPKASDAPEATDTSLDPVWTVHAPDSQDYYFFLPEVPTELYNDTGASLECFLISKTPVETESFQMAPVSAPPELTCSFGITDATGYSLDSAEMNLSFDLWRSYLGTDWAQAAAQLMEYQEAKLTNSGELTAEEKASLRQVVTDYEAADQAARDIYYAQLEELEKLTEPRFYAYIVRFNFNASPDPPEDTHITAFSISWEGVSFEAPCDITIHWGDAFIGLTHISSSNFQNPLCGTFNAVTTLYGDGVCEAYVEDFTTTEDIVLQSALFVKDGPEIQRLHVITTQTDGVSTDYFWDGASSVVVPAGTQVVMFATFQLDALAGISTAGTVFFQLNYKTAQGEASAVTYSGLVSNRNFQELAAIYFDGIDLESYYREYYNPCIRDNA